MSMLNGIDKIFLIICEIYINKTKIKKLINNFTSKKQE